jgi:hypothetical protein
VYWVKLLSGLAQVTLTQIRKMLGSYTGWGIGYLEVCFFFPVTTITQWIYLPYFTIAFFPIFTKSSKKRFHHNTLHNSDLDAIKTTPPPKLTFGRDGISWSHAHSMWIKTPWRAVDATHRGRLRDRLAYRWRGRELELQPALLTQNCSKQSISGIKWDYRGGGETMTRWRQDTWKGEPLTN